MDQIIARRLAKLLNETHPDLTHVATTEDAYPSQLLDGLHVGVRDKWGNGTAAVPLVDEVRADAKRCIESLVAVR